MHVYNVFWLYSPPLPSLFLLTFFLIPFVSSIILSFSFYLPLLPPFSSPSLPSFLQVLIYRFAQLIRISNPPDLPSLASQNWNYRCAYHGQLNSFLHLFCVYACVYACTDIRVPWCACRGQDNSLELVSSPAMGFGDWAQVIRLAEQVLFTHWASSLAPKFAFFF